MLDEKKEITGAELTAAFVATGYGVGTAASQSGQIMNLFSTLGIVTRTGRTAKLNEKSAIAEKMRKVLSAS